MRGRDAVSVPSGLRTQVRVCIVCKCTRPARHMSARGRPYESSPTGRVDTEELPSAPAVGFSPLLRRNALACSSGWAPGFPMVASTRALARADARQAAGVDARVRHKQGAAPRRTSGPTGSPEYRGSEERPPHADVTPPAARGERPIFPCRTTPPRCSTSIVLAVGGGAARDSHPSTHACGQPEYHAGHGEPPY